MSVSQLRKRGHARVHIVQPLTPWVQSVGPPSSSTFQGRYTPPWSSYFKTSWGQAMMHAAHPVHSPDVTTSLYRWAQCGFSGGTAPTVASALVPELPEVEAYRRLAEGALGRPVERAVVGDRRFVRGHVVTPTPPSPRWPAGLVHPGPASRQAASAALTLAHGPRRAARSGLRAALRHDGAAARSTGVPGWTGSSTRASATSRRGTGSPSASRTVAGWWCATRACSAGSSSTPTSRCSGPTPSRSPPPSCAGPSSTARWRSRPGSWTSTAWPAWATSSPTRCCGAPRSPLTDVPAH